MERSLKATIISDPDVSESPGISSQEIRASAKDLLDLETLEQQMNRMRDYCLKVKDLQAQLHQHHKKSDRKEIEYQLQEWLSKTEVLLVAFEATIENDCPPRSWLEVLLGRGRRTMLRRRSFLKVLREYRHMLFDVEAPLKQQELSILGILRKKVRDEIILKMSGDDIIATVFITLLVIGAIVAVVLKHKP